MSARSYNSDFDCVVQERFAAASAVPFPIEIIPTNNKDIIDYEYIAAVQAFNPERLFEYMQSPQSLFMNGSTMNPKKG